MKKYLLFLILILSILSPQFTYGECEYLEQFEDCKKRNDTGQPQLATDYLCVDSLNDERILYNIILDDKFSAVDKEAYEFLAWLEASKDYFFGTYANASYFQGVDLIGIKFGKYEEYWNKYSKLCDLGNTDSISAKVFECVGENSQVNASVTTENAKNYLSTSSCMDLAETKLGIYEIVGYDLLKINKAIIRKDNRKTFMQSQRIKYENLLGAMRTNIGYLERIWKKWPSKTKSPYEG